MAYTPCATSKVLISAAKDCEKPAFEGLKMVAVAVAKNDIQTIVRGAGASKNQVSTLTLKTDAKTFVIEAGGETPFADSAEEFDAATKKWNKTVSFVAPAHGATFSAGLVEPLLTNLDGYVVILQRKDNNGDCSYPIIGLERGAVGSAGSLNYTDSATGGSHSLSLVETNAPSAEIDLWDTDQETTDAAFAALLAKAV